MITRCEGFDWPGTEQKVYKDTPGSWEGVTRRPLLGGTQAAFEVRYFEVAVGGYTSYERHEHEHFVVVVRGKGRVRLEDDWTDIGLNDAVHVPSMTPHQFATEGNEPLGFVCIVDKERDKPILIDPLPELHTSER